jgi:hypothetical protein
MDVAAGVIQGSVLGPILFIIFIADINSYMPAGVIIEKYADDIIAYILGKATNSSLPQEVVDAVQRWCVVNKMRLNTDKCKVLHVPGNDTPYGPYHPGHSWMVTLDNNALEVVSSYKYLGVEINTKLNWNQQWQRVKLMTRSTPFLIKRLRRTGFERGILVNVYRSLVLSHFNYSSPLLTTSSRSDKHEMQMFQKRLLRIIGINTPEELKKYNIVDIETHIENAAVSKIRKVLSNPHHPLNKRYARTNARTGKMALMVPKPKTKKYTNSIVPKCVRILRDGAEDLYTTAAKRAPVVLIPTPPKEPKVPCPLCKRFYKNEKGLKIHLSACKKKTQTPAAATESAATTKSTKKKAGKVTTATTNKTTKTTTTTKKKTATTAKRQPRKQNLGPKTK